MQTSSIDSPILHLGVNAALGDNLVASLPLTGNIANIDVRPQTTGSDQNPEIVGITQNPILYRLQGAGQNRQELLHEQEENQFTSVLMSLSKLDELYNDEDLLKLLIKNNDPRKYIYTQLYTSALQSQAAWFRVKNRVLDSMYFTLQGKTHNMSQGMIGLAVAVTNLINNKIKHQTCLNKIQSGNFDDLSNDDKAARQRTNKELEREMKKARDVLALYRREYCCSLPLRGIEEGAIIENLPQYLLTGNAFAAIKKIFTSLPEEKIKALVRYHISSLPSSISSIDKMEENEFKIQRKPVPESFWNSLEKCSEQGWSEFNKHFFLFILSSWLSEPEYLLWQKRELKEAIETNNVCEECRILVDKLLQLSLRSCARKILYQILIFAKEHERAISAGGYDIVRHSLTYANKESELAKLNEAYASAFAKTYLSYVDKKKIDWSSKTPEECQVQANLLEREIYVAHLSKKQLSDNERLDTRNFLGFIYAVLLHFRDNFSIQLTDLNDIANRTIIKTTAEHIQEISALSERSRNNALTLGVSEQSLKRKRPEDNWWDASTFEQRFQISPPDSPAPPSVDSNQVAIHSQVEFDENTENVTSYSAQEVQFQQLLEDIQSIIDKDNQVTTTQEQTFEHEKITLDELESPANKLMLAAEEEKVPEYRLPQFASQSATSEILTLPRLKFFPKIFDLKSESEEASSLRVLNFESHPVAEEQSVSVFEQEAALAQFFPQSSTQETLTASAGIEDYGVMHQLLYDFE